MANCQFCWIQEKTTRERVVFWVECPNFGEKLRHLLDKNGVGHEGEGEFVLFANAADSLAAMGVFERELLQTERRQVRVIESGLGAMLHPRSLEEHLAILRTGWFDRAWRDDAFRVWVQPIVAAKSHEVVARECLIRLEDPMRTGEQILEAAIVRRKLSHFDAYARCMAIRQGAEGHVSGHKLFVNFMPGAITDPEYCMRSTLEAFAESGLEARDLVFEVVGSECVEDTRHLRKIRSFVAKQGFEFSLGDAGHHASILSVILELRPEYVKIGRGFVFGLDQKGRRESLERLVAISRQAGAYVVAEGIETATQSEALENLGATHLQGWHFGMPSPAFSPLARMSEVLELR